LPFTDRLGLPEKLGQGDSSASVNARRGTGQ
jgi:hypothetical protein